MLRRTYWVFLAAFCAGSLAPAAGAADGPAELENLPVVDISRQTRCAGPGTLWVRL